MRFASVRSAPLRSAPRRFASEVRAARSAPRRSAPHEVRPAEVCPAEVWTNGTLFCPPRIPSLNALPEEFEMLFIGHCLPPASASSRARLRQPPP